MNKRKIGSSDLFVSEIGLGCMSLGQELATARSIIDAALEQGINYLDTADLYDQGLNEEMIGQILKGKRHEVILATKVGNRFTKGVDGWEWDPSKAHIKEAVKGSLQRLQTDYIDLYQLHGGTINDPFEETIEAFEELKKEGTIRYYGLSSIRPNVIERFLTHSSIVSVMMQFSLLDRRPEEWFPLFNEHQVSVIPRGPVAKGILSTKPLPPEKGYSSYSYDELVQLRSRLATLHRPLHEIGIQYCLAHDVVATVAAGASSPTQVTENINGALADRLTEKELDVIQSVTKLDLYEEHRT